MTGLPSSASSAVIEIIFTGYWLSGTGISRGRHVDEVTYRDEYGCPAMPMTQIKGLLRNTARHLAEGEQGHWTADLVNRIFGSDKNEAALRFAGNAALPEDIAAWFRSDPASRSQLYRILPSTMIGDRGAAEQRTLRNVEVAVPMTISASIASNPDRPIDFNWVNLIDSACIATCALGKSKFDGLGRALLSCREVPR